MLDISNHQNLSERIDHGENNPVHEKAKFQQEKKTPVDRPHSLRLQIGKRALRQISDEGSSKTGRIGRLHTPETDRGFSFTGDLASTYTTTRQRISRVDTDMTTTPEQTVEVLGTKLSSFGIYLSFLESVLDIFYDERLAKQFGEIKNLLSSINDKYCKIADSADENLMFLVFKFRTSVQEEWSLIKVSMKKIQEKLEQMCRRKMFKVETQKSVATRYKYLTEIYNDINGEIF